MTKEMRSESDIPDPNVLPQKMTSFILGPVHWFVSDVLMYEQEVEGAKGYFHEPIGLPVSA